MRLSRLPAFVTASVWIALTIAATVLLAWVAPKKTSHASAQEAITPAASRQDWAAYNGGANGEHYSPLAQITPANVHLLKPAWRFNAGTDGGLQVNPLVVGRVLYGYTATLQVIALDAATGKQIWTFDPGISARQPSRGFTYWTDGHESRLFAYVMNFLYALDPQTGKPIAGFGEGGRLDLRKDLDSDYTQNTVALTTPGVLYKDVLIVGFRAPEANPAPRGDIRAYNVRTGKLAWSFHTIPHPGEEGYETWPAGAWRTAGAANNWPGMSVDDKRGIVFVPTGSAVSDFYGYDRIGDDLYANTLLALDASTGRKLWHFQDVHHDIWDRDFPAPPALVTVMHDGKPVDAVAQTTKHGFVFLFDRVTGKPLFPVEERAFPASTVPGEVAARTQPIPLAPAPFARQRLTADMLTKRTPAAHAWAVRQFKTFRSGGQFVPLAVDQQTVVFPGFDGGAEWGGPAVDPRSGVIYINANDLPWTGALTENKSGSPGYITYETQCAVCHGADRTGNPPAFPSLVHIDKKLTQAQIAEVVHNGKGRMPGFPAIQDQRLAQLLEFVQTGRGAASDPASVSPESGVDSVGAKVYQKNCALCHGDNRLGAPSNYPALVGVRTRLTDAQIVSNIHNGKGRMPGFPKLTADDNAALLRFLGPPATTATASVGAGAEKRELTSAAPLDGSRPKYGFTGYRRFLDPDGYPAVVPPWGTLNAIDLNTGRYLWKVPLGEYRELAAHGLTNTGCENYGGPVVTAGGMLFIGATIYDRKLRAFEASTGKLLWQADLPYAGTATPSTYMVDGKQYIVIATSGARDTRGPQGAAYVAFALP